MFIIDTHCHLFLPEFDNDRNSIIDESKQNGITYLINPNVDSSTLENLYQLHITYPDTVLAAYGLHPCSVKANYSEELSQIKKFATDKPFVAIGEIGIDLYWDTTFKNEQIDAFLMQLKWAYELNKPVIIHTRNAMELVIDLVKKAPGVTGVFHAFTGTYDQAMKIIELGYFLGIGGILTYKNSGLDMVVEKLPLERILIETDSPYLPPVPHRGKRNKPSYLVHILEKIAILKNKKIDEITTITTQNALHLFKIKEAGG